MPFGVLFLVCTLAFGIASSVGLAKTLEHYGVEFPVQDGSFKRDCLWALFWIVLVTPLMGLLWAGWFQLLFNWIVI